MRPYSLSSARLPDAPHLLHPVPQDPSRETLEASERDLLVVSVSDAEVRQESEKELDDGVQQVVHCDAKIDQLQLAADYDGKRRWDPAVTLSWWRE